LLAFVLQLLGILFEVAVLDQKFSIGFQSVGGVGHCFIEG
jgi:hypothetical protein